MDKKTLNNEIVLCRAAVRKAKVAVIRKILKRIKILKSCKVETVKEKKLRKSERLLQKVQIIKKIKVDEVTKFALRNIDLEPFLEAAKVELKENALASLAKHNAVAKKITSIRERIPNWETELSPLLDSLGKNRKKLKSKKDPKMISSKDKPSEKLVKKSEVSRLKKGEKTEVVPKEEETKKPGKLTHTKFEAATAAAASDSDSDPSKEESDSSFTEHSPDSSEKVEQVKKIVDPFFIGKTVIAPKLALNTSSDRKSEEKVSRLREGKPKRETNRFMPERKKSRELNRFTPQPPKKVAEEEALHPSWAAKKVKLIKPFQGKKIKFSDD